MCASRYIECAICLNTEYYVIGLRDLFDLLTYIHLLTYIAETRLNMETNSRRSGQDQPRTVEPVMVPVRRPTVSSTALTSCLVTNFLASRVR